VVKVMDFGLVKDTSESDSDLSAVDEICGTPETLAPETIRGWESRPPVDLYALGAVGCYLLTGKPIFDAETVLAFMNLHLMEDPVPPSSRVPGVPTDLEEVLLACLAKEPEDRPDSAAVLRESLLACESAGEWTPADAAAWWEEWRLRGTGSPTPAAR
jgi:serine/threonine protein kinase